VGDYTGKGGSEGIFHKLPVGLYIYHACGDDCFCHSFPLSLSLSPPFSRFLGIDFLVCFSHNDMFMF